MNPGDKVRVTYGPYKNSVGELVEYRQHTKWSTPFCRVKIPGFSFEIAIDPWDIELFEPDEGEPNEADTAAASNL